MNGAGKCVVPGPLLWPYCVSLPSSVCESGQLKTGRGASCNRHDTVTKQT